MNTFDIGKYFDKLPFIESGSNSMYDALKLLVEKNYTLVSYNYEEKIDVKKYSLQEDEYNTKFIEIPMYYICDVISGCCTDSNIILELVINNRRMLLNKNTKIFMVASRKTLHYIRFTFKDKIKDSFKFYYTGFAGSMKIRESLIPPPNYIYYSGRLKYDNNAHNLSNVNII